MPHKEVEWCVYGDAEIGWIGVGVVTQRSSDGEVALIKRRPNTREDLWLVKELRIFKEPKEAATFLLANT